MSLRYKLAVATLTVMSFACGLSQEKTITPGEIKFTPKSLKYRLIGTFTISTVDTGGIPSDGLGGACLITDLNVELIPKMSPARTCSTNDQCGHFEAAQAGWSGYCDKEHQKCWVRPGAQNDQALCNTGQVWPENVAIDSNVVPFDLGEPRYAQAVSGAPLLSFTQAYPGLHDWRVVACLNGLGLIDDKPPCKTPDAPENLKMLRFGPISPKRGIKQRHPPKTNHFPNPRPIPQHSPR